MPHDETYRALLAGATGLVGFQLFGQLLRDDRCGGLTILVRRPIRLLPELAAYQDKLTVITADFDRMDEALSGVEADVVFCALGTTIRKAGSQEAFRQVDLMYPAALGEWAKTNGARKFIVISAMGANAKSSIFYNRVKGEMEARLGELGLQEVHIVRPSLLLGKRDELRLGEKAAILLNPVLQVLLQGPLRKYRPVRAEAVATFMRHLAGSTLREGAGPRSVIHENGELTAARPIL